MKLRSSLAPLRIILIFFAGLFLVHFTHMNFALVKAFFTQWAVPKHSSFELSVPLADVLSVEPRPTPGRSIFLLDTTRIHRAKTKVLHNIVNLTSRQACAVESAALHNPNLDVFVLFTVPTFQYMGNNTDLIEPVIKALMSYENVYFRQLNYVRYAQGTPIGDWVKFRKLFTTSYPVEQISDLLRFLTLYRYGGIYLDMDVVVLRSLEKLPLNYAGAETSTSIGNGVIGLSPNGSGHEVAKAFLLEYRDSFSSYDWRNNGPGVVTRVVKKLCGKDEISLMLENPTLCKGFRVMNRSAFFAVHPDDWRDFFEASCLNKTLYDTKKSYLVHVWNALSKERKVKLGSGTPYELLAKNNCPRVHKVMGEYF